MRRPVVVAVGAVAVLLVIASPILVCIRFTGSDARRRCPIQISAGKVAESRSNDFEKPTQRPRCASCSRAPTKISRRGVSPDELRSAGSRTSRASRRSPHPSGSTARPLGDRRGAFGRSGPWTPSAKDTADRVNDSWDGVSAHASLFTGCHSADFPPREDGIPRRPAAAGHRCARGRDPAAALRLHSARLILPFKRLVLNLNTLSTAAALGFPGVGLPGRQPLRAARLHRDRCHRHVDADPDVLHRLRVVDGLRGVPPLPHQGGARPNGRQRSRRRPRSRADGPHRHGRGAACSRSPSSPSGRLA